MCNYIIAGIVAIVIYQIITFVIYLISGENEEVLGAIATFVPFVVFLLFASIYKKIRLVYYRRNYNAYRFCYTTSNGMKDKSLGMFFARPKDLTEFVQDENSKYYIELYRNGKDFKSAPYKSQVYRGQKHLQGWSMDLFKKV